MKSYRLRSPRTPRVGRPSGARWAVSLVGVEEAVLVHLLAAVAAALVTIWDAEPPAAGVLPRDRCLAALGAAPASPAEAAV